MMDTRRRISPKLQEVLDKMGYKPKVTKRHEPITYAPKDIIAAKTVLDRLMANADRNIVVSIIAEPKSLDEK